MIGSLSYASLRALHVSPRDTMLIMLFFPALEAFSFWIILRKPTIIPLTNSSLESTEELVTDEKPLRSFKEKLIYIKTLFPYMLPLALVYFFEYLINQGLVSVWKVNFTYFYLFYHFPAFFTNSLNWSTSRTALYHRPPNIAGSMWTIKLASSSHAHRLIYTKSTKSGLWLSFSLSTLLTFSPKLYFSIRQVFGSHWLLCCGRVCWAVAPM